MHVVFDAVAVRPGSAAVTLQNLLHGWRGAAPEDTITVLTEGEVPPFELPPGTGVRTVRSPARGGLGALWSRSVGVRRAARDLQADGVVSGVTASAFLGTGCPRGVILYDLRHEHRPHQFSSVRRIVRKASYAWSFRTADGLYCISERTRDDLVRTRPRLAAKAVLARYGADHVDSWPAAEVTTTRYALAFGQFANKNVDAVLDAWAVFCRTNSELSLRLVGMGGADREAATGRVAALGIADRVELMPWLDDAEFVACFAGASLVVFPSDFEGFGLPAVEALRLQIPLVVSADVALSEVTGGHAEVVAAIDPDSLAAAMVRALDHSSQDLAAGRDYTERFKWQHMATSIRDHLRQAQTATETVAAPA